MPINSLFLDRASCDSYLDEPLLWEVHAKDEYLCFLLAELHRRVKDPIRKRTMLTHCLMD